jgi:hypothetical protein
MIDSTSTPSLCTLEREEDRPPKTNISSIYRERRVMQSGFPELLNSQGMRTRDHFSVSNFNSSGSLPIPEVPALLQASRPVRLRAGACFLGRRRDMRAS